MKRYLIYLRLAEMLMMGTEEVMLFCLLTGIRDLIAYSILGGGVTTQNSGYKGTRLWPLFFLGYLFSLPQTMVLVPPLPPPRFTRVSCPSVQFSCTYSLSPPIASFLSVCRLFDRPPPAAPVVTHRPLVVSLQPSDWLPANAKLPLISCPVSRSMKVCPPTYAAGSTCSKCGWRGVGYGAPFNIWPSTSSSAGCHQSSVGCKSTTFRLTAGQCQATPDFLSSFLKY